MKYSLYNSILPLNDKLSLLYSGFTDEFIVFRKNLEPFLYSLSPDSLNKVAPGLWGEMIKGGAIVNDSKDEYNDLKILSAQKDNASEEFRLIINPTMDCIFKCWYCYENHIVKSQMSEDVILKVKKLIRYILKEKKIKKFYLSFFGGEPLMYYDEVIRPLIDFSRFECKKNNIVLDIFFTSNGYLVDEQIILHLKGNKDIKCFQITLDGYRDTHNSVRYNKKITNSYERIIANIYKLIDNEIEVLLRINYSTRNVESLENILSDLKMLKEDKRKYLSIGFHRVWQDQKVEKKYNDILKNCIEKFKEEFFSVSDSLYMNDLRFPCYADKTNEAVINYNGDVYKCTARDFSLENRCGILSEDGIILWNKKMEERKGIKLNRHFCKTCRLLPLCGGGCSQKSIEISAEEECIMGFDEIFKDKIILERFYNRFVK